MYEGCCSLLATQNKREEKKLCQRKCLLESKNNGEFNRGIKNMIFEGCPSN